MKWKIYYSDGSTFDSTQGGPEQAPSYHAVVVVQEDAPGTSAAGQVGRQMLTGDYFAWRRGRWWSHDLVGIFQMWDYPGWQKVITGEGMLVPEYYELYEHAKTDPFFPRKSAWRKGEYRHGGLP